MPLPPGFDAKALQGGLSKDPYQLTAEVTGAVFCGWLRSWNESLDHGDATAAASAADAIASSRRGAALTTMTGGDWNKAIWDFADRVTNGDCNVVEMAQKGLGCTP